MEGQNQIPPVDESTPAQIVQPQPKKNKKTISIIATVLILILIGISVGYFLSAQKKNNLQSNPPTSQTPSITAPVSPTSTANAATRVVTIPLNATEYVKEVVTEDNCNNPIGLVSYHDTKNNIWMKINSLLDAQNKDSENGLSQIEAYLKDATSLQSYQDINDWEFPFRNYCGGSSNLFVKELNGIAFPNTESSKSMIIYTTQSVHGNVTVAVLAKNGNDIIQLSKYMDDKSLYQQFENACILNPEDYQQSESCYRDKLLQDANLQNAAINQAKVLISQFAIK